MPAKKVENEIRRERREKAKKEALEMIKKNGNRINSDIMRKCMQAIHVTPEIIYRVITVCRKLNVPVIVSPYEADAQISYLCRSGIADFAVSEDSDLIVYGCPKILYKLGRDGKAMELNVPFFTVSKNPFNTVDCSGNNSSNSNNGQDNKDMNSQNSKNSQDKDNNKVLNNNRAKEALETKVKDGLFKGLNHKMFVIMCVLSGTDYDNGWHISGMGLKVAYKLVLEHENLEGILKSIYGNTKWADKVPELSYEALLTHYTNVYNIFLHNIVFNPRNNQLVHINPVYTLNSFMNNNSNTNNNGANNTSNSSGYTGNINLLRGYNYVYDMCLNIVNKGPNFINVARGLVSVVDDMEIKYMLTATDLEIVDSLPEHISSYNKVNKGSKKDVDNNLSKYMKIKFDLYAVNKKNNSNSNNGQDNKDMNSQNSKNSQDKDNNNNTQFVLISTLCDSSLFSKLGDMDELYKKLGVEQYVDGKLQLVSSSEDKQKMVKVVKEEKNMGNDKSNMNSGNKDSSNKDNRVDKDKDNNKVLDNKNKMGVRTKLPELPKTEIVDRSKEKLVVKDRYGGNLKVKQVKKEYPSNSNNTNSSNMNGELVNNRQNVKKTMDTSVVNKLPKVSKADKKRKVMELLNKTESYTVKRTRVKRT